MSEMGVGDRVSFRAGKGYSEGRVANVAENAAGVKSLSIATDKGKLVHRLASACQRVESAAKVALQPLHPVAREALAGARLDGETRVVGMPAANELAIAEGL